MADLLLSEASDGQLAISKIFYGERLRGFLPRLWVVLLLGS